MDIREFLGRLKSAGMLISIDEELDPKFEVSAVLKALGKKKDGPAVLFNNVKGYDVPVCGNLLSDEKKLALALDVDERVLWKEYKKRLAQPIPPSLQKEGPVQQVIIEDIDIPGTIPVLTYHEKDASPYITQGVTFLKDPETGHSTMGVHRLQVKARDRLGFYVSAASVTSARLLEEAEKKGKSLPVAVAIGVEPSILLACYSISGKDNVDKVHMAGGLACEPVALVKGKTVDIEVPANAMFIIEGEILPGIREKDGPFGEVLGYYISGQGFVIDAKLITHQNNPIYCVSQPFSRDDHIDTMMKMQIEGLLKRMIPNLKSIAFHFPSSLVILSIEKKNPWDSRSALYSCLNMLVFAKYVIVVDDDVDPNNMEDVGFALAGRCQPDRDIIVMNDVLGFDLDPSLKEGGLTAKLGLDATKRLDQPERFEKIQVPKASMDKASEILRKYL